MTVSVVLVAALLLMFGVYLARPIKSKGNRSSCLHRVFVAFSLLTMTGFPVSVEEVKKLVSSGLGSKPRFRKRDKVLFYGRKMLRKVSSVKDKMTYISGQVKGPPGRKRKLVKNFTMKLAGGLKRRLLRLRRENAPQQLKVIEPPVEYLQEDSSESTDQRLPPEVVYMLQNIRMFGNFEKPLFLELIKHLETVNLMTGQYLFSVGDPDAYIYIVQSGQLDVFITDSDGSMISLKHVNPGESVCSLLSFTDILTGQPSIFKTVSARAREESCILQLPFAAFQEVFEKHPDALVRAMQIIMVRLQRVTFLALHQYLGLSAELVKSYPSGKHSHHNSQHHNHAGSSSPVKLRMREPFFPKMASPALEKSSPTSETDHASFVPPTPPPEASRRRQKEEKDHGQLIQSAVDGFVKVIIVEFH